MRHLIAKDIRLVAPYLWLIAPGHFLWCLQASLDPAIYFWMSLAAALAWTASVAMIEWHFDADRLVASLPVTRAAIVQARYVSALGGVALGAVLFVVYTRAVMAVADERLIARWQCALASLSADVVIAFVVIGFAAVIGFLPFYFRLGLARGAAWFSVTAVVLVSAITGLALLAETAGVPGGAAALVHPGEVVGGWLQALSSRLGTWPAWLLLLAGALTLGVLSVRLSTRFYEGRDL